MRVSLSPRGLLALFLLPGLFRFHPFFSPVIRARRTNITQFFIEKEVFIVDVFPFFLNERIASFPLFDMEYIRRLSF